MDNFELEKFLSDPNNSFKEKLIEEITLKLKSSMKDTLSLKQDVEKYKESLLETASKFLEENKFEVGKFVKWKNGLRNRSVPDYNEPAIIIELLNNPKYVDDQEYLSPDYHEPLDLILGILDEDGDFVTYHFDKRRFEKFN